MKITYVAQGHPTVSSLCIYAMSLNKERMPGSLTLAANMRQTRKRSQDRIQLLTQKEFPRLYF